MQLSREAPRISPMFNKARCWSREANVTVEDGQLQVVEFDDGVIHAHADEGRQQVLGGGDKDALLHQTGGVADFRDVFADGGYIESVEVNPAEHYPRTCRGGQDSQMYRRSTMKPDATAFDGGPNCALKDQGGCIRVALSVDYKLEAMSECCIYATSSGEVGTHLCNPWALPRRKPLIQNVLSLVGHKSRSLGDGPTVSIPGTFAGCT